FRLLQETEIPGFTETTRHIADAQRTGKPERVQKARTAAELRDALLAPGQMILFFTRGLRERLLRFRIARSKRLPLIERLRTNFSAVIHTHQRGGQFTFFSV